MSGIQQLLLGGPFGGGAVGDPYWQYTNLLLGTSATSGSQNNTFTDSSSNAFSITRNGNTTQGSFSPFSAPSGYWGNYFDGSGDYLTCADSADWAFGSGNFTIECWLYNTGTDGFIVSQTDNSSSNGSSFVLYITSGALNALLYYGGGSFISITDPTSFPKNQWTHVALVRNSTTATLYVNGRSVGTGSLSTNSLNDVSSSLSIGARTTGGDPFTGYISNLRIVKGSAVYTAAFTPTTAPLSAITNTVLLTCQGNRFYDANTQVTAKTITVNGNPAVVPFTTFGNTTAYTTSAVGGSGYFDGTGDYLSVADSTALTLTGDFTIECWVYTPSISVTDSLIGKWKTSNQEYLLWLASGVATFYFAPFSTGTALLTSSTSIAANSWNHICVTRSGNSFTMYLNGTSVATATNSGTFTDTTAPVEIGSLTDYGGYDYTGYISGVRLIKGSAQTPPSGGPTSPPTAITNTQFLCNFTNAGIFDNAAKNDLETVGNAQVSTSVKKFGNSVQFDGSGDYLISPTPQKQNFVYGTGEFTIECWVRFTTTASFMHIYDQRPASTDGAYPTIRLNTSGNGLEYVQGATVRISGGTITTGVWYHVAVNRSGSSTKMYLDGQQVGSTYTDTTSYLCGDNRPYIGGSGYHVTSLYLDGYLSDVRVTNGYGRYPYSFTPPTQAFGNFYAAPTTPAADPYFDYTTLLLPGSGTNGAQNNTFLDSSTNAFSITRNGNTTQGTFSPFSQTGWSNYFDGAGDYLTVPAGTAFALSGEYTMELWFYPNAISGFVGLLCGSQSNAIWLYLSNAGGVIVLGYNGLDQITTSSAPLIGQWNHIAVSRNSSNVTSVYLNGARIGTATLSTSYSSSTGTFEIGRVSTNTNANGYFSNARVVKGTAVYDPTQTTITVPTTALTAITNTSLLTCQSNRLVDNSANAFTITRNGDVSVQAFSPFAPTAAYSAATNGGSGYFDGSGDYLTTGTSANLAIGTNNFCVECWIYSNATTEQSFFGQWGNSNNDWILQYRTSSGNQIRFFYNSSSDLSGSYTMVTGQWLHLAVCRSGSTMSLYLNGSRLATKTESASITNTNGITLGTNIDVGTQYLNGYMNGARLVVGSSIYDPTQTTISVPTTPLTAVTNTKFLANFTNAGITDATAKNDLETVGNAQISNGAAKWGSTSMYFDGTGDYLLIPDGPNLDFGTGDWTIEAWANFSSVSGTRCIASNYLNSSSGWSIELSAGVIKVALSGDSYDITGTTTISTGTWYHVAVTNYGGSVKLFVNGNQEGSTYTGAVSLDTTSAVNVGRLGTLGGDELNGYIQDLRITKGIARYTQNFTPPTAAFQLL